MRLTVFNEICKPDEALIHYPFNHLIERFHSENLWVVSVVFSDEIRFFENIQSHIFTDITGCELYRSWAGLIPEFTGGCDYRRYD